MRELGVERLCRCGCGGTDPESEYGAFLAYIARLDWETYRIVARLPSTGAGPDQRVDSTLAAAAWARLQMFLKPV